MGALLAGFVAGLLVNGLKKAFSWMPKSMDGIKPVFLYPLFGTVLIGLFMLLINPFVGYINLALSAGLKSLGETSRILLSVVLAAMMATDMGGPFNKAAYVIERGYKDALAKIPELRERIPSPPAIPGSWRR